MRLLKSTGYLHVIDLYSDADFWGHFRVSRSTFKVVGDFLRSVNLKSVMGKARSGGNERLSSLYSKLRTSRDGGSRRGLSPERRSETPKKPSRLLNKLRASSKKKSEMSDSGSER